MRLKHGQLWMRSPSRIRPTSRPTSWQLQRESRAPPCRSFVVEQGPLAGITNRRKDTEHSTAPGMRMAASQAFTSGTNFKPRKAMALLGFTDDEAQLRSITVTSDQNGSRDGLSFMLFIAPALQEHSLFNETFHEQTPRFPTTLHPFFRSATLGLPVFSFHPVCP